jgi:hypothetical protein
MLATSVVISRNVFTIGGLVDLDHLQSLDIFDVSTSVMGFKLRWALLTYLRSCWKSALKLFRNLEII